MEVDPLPKTSINRVIGLLELLNEYGPRKDIYKLAQEINYEFGNLLAVIKGGEAMGFVHTPGGDVELIELGKEMINSDINRRKKIVKDQLKKLSIFQYFIRFLKSIPNKSVEKDIVLEQLAIRLPYERPENMFQTLVNWGRYGELFGYNRDNNEFYLDQEE